MFSCPQAPSLDSHAPPMLSSTASSTPIRAEVRRRFITTTVRDYYIDRRLGLKERYAPPPYTPHNLNIHPARLRLSDYEDDLVIIHPCAYPEAEIDDPSVLPQFSGPFSASSCPFTLLIRNEEIPADQWNHDHCLHTWDVGCMTSIDVLVGQITVTPPTTPRGLGTIKWIKKLTVDIKKTLSLKCV